MKLLALMKKEFVRFFHDPRLIVTMLLPGIIIYLLYSVMGTAIWDSEEKYDYEVYISGCSAAVELMTASAEALGGSLTLMETDDSEAALAAVEDGKATAFLVFSENFDEAVSSYSGYAEASAQIYYRSADDESYAFYTLAVNILSSYQKQFTITAGDCSDESSVIASAMGMVLPFIVIALIFSSCMGVTLESIAGEKERGTLATLLVTPVKRSDIIVGKIVPLGVISLIGAVSSFLGLMLSLPKLLGLSVGGLLSSFGVFQLFLLFLILVCVVPLIVAAVALVSTYAKSVKEASAYTSVVLIVVMALSIVSSFLEFSGWAAAVPFLNTVVCMQNILNGTFAVWEPFAVCAVNLVYAALIVWINAKMLGSERIMFGK